MRRRAVITGIGLLTPLGNSPHEFFSNALAGRNCVSAIKKFDASPFAVRIGAELCRVPPLDQAPASPASFPISTVANWSVISAKAALTDAGIGLVIDDPYSIDVVLGISFSSIEGLTPELLAYGGSGMSVATPATPALMNPASAVIQITRQLGLNGEAVNITTACSSSTSAIGYAVRLIRHGESDCVLAGGADEGVSPMFLGALGNGTYLSRKNESPSAASRPFDRNRDGGVLADGACILVIEERERAISRGARIYCEVTGYGSTSDGMNGKSEEPSAKAIEKAIKDSDKRLDDFQYYCALGISDPKLDVRETRMLKRVFKESAYDLAVSSIKSMMGNPLGAAGAIQTAACALAISQGAVPPTINYSAPDPDCDLDYVPNEARTLKVRNALVYTLGNGGSNTALALSA